MVCIRSVLASSGSSAACEMVTPRTARMTSAIEYSGDRSRLPTSARRTVLKVALAVTPPKLTAQRARVENCFASRCGGRPILSSCRIARRLPRLRAVVTPLANS